MLTPILLVSILAAPEADWPQWRGPARDGRVQGFVIPSEWPAKLSQVWKIDVGEGHASPVVRGGRVYLHARQKDQEFARAIDLATGKVLWSDAVAAPYEMNQYARGHGPGPKSTPTIAGDALVTFGISGILSVLELSSGAVRWRKEFSKEFPATAPEFGTALSPLVEGESVIAHVGGKDQGSLRAFRLRDGATVWSFDGDGPAYSSPVAVELAGARQVVTQTQTRLLGLSLKDGKLLWSLPFATDYDQNSITAAVAGDLLLYSGYQKALAALRLDRANGGISAKEAWRNDDVNLFMSTSVVEGGLVFGMSQKKKGQLFCLEASTGKTLWKGEGGLGDNAAVLTLGGVIAVLTDGAELIFAKAQRAKLELLAKYKVAESPTWAHPALVGDRILIKDKHALIAYRF